MANYTEQAFEEHIEEHLLKSNYTKVDPIDYDKELCLIPSEVIRFIKSTQPEEYEELQTQYGDQTDRKLCQRLSVEIGKPRQGTLYILRKGFRDRSSRFMMAYYKPTSGMNLEHRMLYNANRFTVVRQLKYSTRNENSIDMVIFLNGIPVLTMELKNSLTGQKVEHAIKQYKQDRDPKEPLLAFKRCLVHFAVGNEKVSMTTRLMRGDTRFLPFNLDTENPVNPYGHKTAYLWEDILQPDTLLDLINNYLHIQTTSEKVHDKTKGLIEKETSAMIFPRFHQLDVVRKLLKQVKVDGVGKNYLIQHSAGSGKSNSIAWLAHQLASLYRHDDDKERLFDSIIVVTDRRILDRQLQNTIKQFEQTVGVVKPIEKDSAELKSSLQAGKAIIITTIQKFPVISRSMNALKGKRFAVFVDEAHSSQSGESAKHLKQTLSAGLEDAEKVDKDDFDVEDALLKEIENRGRQNHISYFAFTATPKNKTLELFGRKIDPDKPPVAFHYYTMRQAIEEGFILDVLNNYTTFKRYFKLIKTQDDNESYERSKAVRLLSNYVDLQPHAIDTKVNIMLEHFLNVTSNAMQGKGRAMVVTRSRLHALKYYLAFSRIMKEKGLQYKPLVAFSGAVMDNDTGENHTEAVNGLAAKVSIPDALKTPAYRILIVANKFQTGFDEPLLHTMYVDKRLGGVQAVQTLSRLNRTIKGKTDTMVLDFVNEAEEIKDAFQPYYQRTILEEEADPNKLNDIQSELEQFEVYRVQDLREFAEIFLDPTRPDELIQPLLDQCVVVWRQKDDEEKEEFRSKLQSYIRLYGFLSQIITFTKRTDLEELYIFANALNKKLDRRVSHLPTEILDAVDLDSFRIQKIYEDSIELKKYDSEVEGIKAVSGFMVKEPEHETLSEIIEKLNEIYGLELTGEDKIDVQRIKDKLDKREELKDFMSADNTTANKKKKFDDMLDSIVLDFIHTKLDLYQKLTTPDANQMLKQVLFDAYQQGVDGRQVSGSN